MTSYDAGTARIKVTADGRGFQSEVESIVKRARGELDVKLSADGREIERLRAQIRANAADLNVNVSTAGAGAELAGFRRREEAKVIRQRVVVDQSNAEAFFSRLRGGGLGLPGRGAIRIGVVVAASEAIVQLAGLAAEAGQAYKALSLLPAAGFAASAGLAGLAIGGQGVGDAFKAMKQESSASAGAVTNQAGAVRSARAAQRQLSDAYRESSRNLRDLNNDYADSALNVEDAQVAVQEATDRLNEVQNDPTADRTAKQRADIDYRQSLARLRDAQNANADLAQDTQRENAAGVQGSKEVVAALDAVAAAKEALEQGSGGGGVDKTAEALAKLSPSAREFVLSAKALGPAWTEARKEIQEPLFAGTGPALTSLADAQLPILRNGLAGINREINTGVRSSMLLLTGPQMQRDFALSLSNTQGLFAGLGRSMAPATQALTSLVTVGTSFFPQFGSSIENASNKFDSFITNAARTGQLRDSMQQGLTATHQLGDGITNVGSIIASVFRAAGAQGNQLEGFVNTTQRWADYLKSVKGQDSMMRFFSDARQDLAQWTPLLEALPGLIGSVLDGVHLWSSILLPFLKAGADLLQDHEEVVKLAVAAYLGFKTVGPIIGTIGPAIAGASRVVATEAATATGAIGKMKAGAGGLVGAFNPWIAGAALAGGATIGFISSLKDNEDAVRRFRSQVSEATESQERLTDSLRTSGGYVNDSVTDAQAQRINQMLDQARENAKDAPGIGDRIAAGLAGGFGNTGALDAEGLRARFADQGKDLISQFENIGVSAKDMGNAVTIGGTAFDDLIEKVRGTYGPNSQLEQQLQRQRYEFDQSRQTALLSLSTAYKALGDDAGGAADKIARLTNALDAQNKQANGVEDARLKAAEAQANLTQGLSLDDPARVRPDGTIDFDNESGRSLQRNIEALQSGYGSAIAAAATQAKENKLNNEQEYESVKQVSQAYLDKAEQQLIAARIPQPEVDSLLAKYKLTDGDFEANFYANTVPANASLDTLLKKMRGIYDDPAYKSISGVVGNLMVQQQQSVAPKPAPNAAPQDPAKLLQQVLAGKATGGFLPTTGPGTDREDGIVAMANGVPIARVNGGEHITNTPMSQKYARELTMINAGTFPKYAAGGVLPGGVTAEEQNILGGGVINSSLWQAIKAQFPTATLSSGYRAGDPGYHGIKQAIDVGGPMQQIADWLYGMKNQLAQIIWNPGPAWYNVKKNQVGTGVATADGAAARALYGEGTMAQHGDHVHVAAEDPIQGQVGTGTAASGAAMNAATTTTSQVTYAQQALPGNMSERDLSILQGKASVDQANSDRNKVYADPNSTAADKQAADIKYLQAQNSLQSTQDGDTERFTLKGFATKGVGILVDGLLGGLGLENSILAGSNPYNQAFTKAADFYGFMKGDAYGYTPQNLPSTVTTTTMTPSVATGTPTPATPAPQAPTQVAYNPSGGVEQWRATFASVLNTLGAPASLLEPGLKQMQTESGGNPKAINLWDSNAAKGTPSKGLMQVIDPTFAAFKSDKYPNDIWDPQANIAAAVSYGAKTYPDLAAKWGDGTGYDQGGVAVGMGFMPKLTPLKERVLSPRQTDTFESILPLMEQINSSAPRSMSVSATPVMSAPAASAGADNSTHFHGDNYAQNPEEMFDLWERKAALAGIGTLGGFS